MAIALMQIYNILTLNNVDSQNTNYEYLIWGYANQL